jgi:nitrogen fixation NifU-like protein
MTSAIPEPQLDDLYRELILDHYRHPHNRGKLEGATHAEGYNPLCGDEIELDVAVGEGGVIEDIAFSGRGCSISQASASMMTDIVKGQPAGAAARIGEEFRSMMTEDAEPSPELGDLEAFQGVSKFPVRVKCATLAWRVLEDALNGNAAVEVKGDER